MANAYLRTITNRFQDVRLVSLRTWKKAAEINPRDHGGPYVALQEGFSPDDMTLTAEEFILGRSGKWLSLGHFFRLPVGERQAEFVFGTAAEVMQMMSDLPSKAVMFGKMSAEEMAEAPPENDDMAAAIQTAKQSQSKPKGS
jgi:hypothetical protein